jgi:hypothetical protein
MTLLWTIAGIAVGGGLGWLHGRYNSRNRHRQDCETPT